MPRSFLRLRQTCAIELGDLDGCQVDPFRAPEIEGEHGFSVAGGALAERSAPARLAELMPNRVALERIDRQFAAGRFQNERVRCREEEQVALRAADGAVARHRLTRLGVDPI